MNPHYRYLMTKNDPHNEGDLYILDDQFIDDHGFIRMVCRLWIQSDGIVIVHNINNTYMNPYHIENDILTRDQFWSLVAYRLATWGFASK